MSFESGRVVYVNGEYVPERDAKISIFDSALMFGDMVFEMTRSFNKQQFRLEEHINRLFIGLKILEIPVPFSSGDLIDICMDVVERNEPVFSETDEHRLMINVSRGPLSIYSPVFNSPIQPTVVVADFPLKWTVAGMGELFDKGINAVVPSQRAIPASLMDPKIKNRSRLFYQTANIEVSKVKGDRNWALLVDPDGNVAEGTGDNFFIVRGNTIISPEGRNILRGISRDYISEIAEEIGLEYVEMNFGLYDVFSADEAFMTGTPFCILPVTSINDVPIGTGSVGTTTIDLLNLWGSKVNVDIANQIRKFNEETRLPVGTTPYSF